MRRQKFNIFLLFIFFWMKPNLTYTTFLPTRLRQTISPISAFPWAQSGDPYFFNKFEQQAPERLLNLGISNEFYQNPKTPSTLLPPDVEPQSHLSVHLPADDLIVCFCQLLLKSLSDKFVGELRLL